VKGCKKCCIYSAVDKSNDGMLWNGSEEIADVRSESGENEDIDCEDGDSDTEW
jgi:hypothetical protein